MKRFMSLLLLPCITWAAETRLPAQTLSEQTLAPASYWVKPSRPWPEDIQKLRPALPVTYRAVRMEDFEALRAFRNAYFLSPNLEPDSSDHFNFIFEKIVYRRASGAAILAEVGKQLVGYALAHTIFSGLSTAYIPEWAVHEDYRRNGIGTALFERLIERLMAYSDIRWVNVHDASGHGITTKVATALGFTQGQIDLRLRLPHRTTPAYPVHPHSLADTVRDKLRQQWDSDIEAQTYRTMPWRIAFETIEDVGIAQHLFWGPEGPYIHLHAHQKIGLIFPLHVNTSRIQVGDPWMESAPYYVPVHSVFEGKLSDWLKEEVLPLVNKPYVSQIIRESIANKKSALYSPGQALGVSVTPGNEEVLYMAINSHRVWWDNETDLFTPAPARIDRSKIVTFLRSRPEQTYTQLISPLAIARSVLQSWKRVQMHRPNVYPTSKQKRQIRQARRILAQAA